jgi:hypothetical protein
MVQIPSVSALRGVRFFAASVTIANHAIQDVSHTVGATLR